MAGRSPVRHLSGAQFSGNYGSCDCNTPDSRHGGTMQAKAGSRLTVKKLREVKHRCVACGRVFKAASLPPHRRLDTGEECIGIVGQPVLK